MCLQAKLWYTLIPKLRTNQMAWIHLSVLESHYISLFLSQSSTRSSENLQSQTPHGHRSNQGQGKSKPALQWRLHTVHTIHSNVFASYIHHYIFVNICLSFFHWAKKPEKLPSLMFMYMTKCWWCSGLQVKSQFVGKWAAGWRSVLSGCFFIVTLVLHCY